VISKPLAVSLPRTPLVHPVALYDLILTTALMLVLLWFLRSPRATGSAIALFTLWYAGGRLLTDFLRTDPRRFAGLTGSQLTSIAAIGVVSVALWLRARRGSSAARVPSASPG
jgi:prolipoprotein diacylglyceryltransferase